MLKYHKTTRLIMTIIKMQIMQIKIWKKITMNIKIRKEKIRKNF